MRTLKFIFVLSVLCPAFGFAGPVYFTNLIQPTASGSIINTNVIPQQYAAAFQTALENPGLPVDLGQSPSGSYVILRGMSGDMGGAGNGIQEAKNFMQGVASADGSWVTILQGPDFTGALEANIAVAQTYASPLAFGGLASNIEAPYTGAPALATDTVGILPAGTVAIRDAKFVVVLIDGAGGNPITVAQNYIGLVNATLKPGDSLSSLSPGASLENQINQIFTQVTRASDGSWTNAEHIEDLLKNVLPQFSHANAEYGQAINNIIAGNTNSLVVLEYITANATDSAGAKLGLELTKLAYRNPTFISGLRSLATGIANPATRSTVLVGAAGGLAEGLLAGAISQGSLWGLGWLEHQDYNQLHQEGITSGCGNDFLCAMNHVFTGQTAQQYYGAGPNAQIFCASSISCTVMTPTAGADYSQTAGNNTNLLTPVVLTQAYANGPTVDNPPGQPQGTIINTVFADGSTGGGSTNNIPSQAVELDYYTFSNGGSLPGNNGALGGDSNDILVINVNVTPGQGQQWAQSTSMFLQVDSNGNVTNPDTNITWPDYSSNWTEESYPSNNNPGYIDPIGSEGWGVLDYGSPDAMVTNTDFGTGLGGSGCFVAGTPVETPHGQVPIEKIKAGDQVYSYDIGNKKTVVGTVVESLVLPDKPYGHVEFADGTALDVTPEHRFYLPEAHRWQEIGQLKPGDKVMRGLEKDAHVVAIKSVDFSDAKKLATVYNFHVDKFMNYYVSGILVHNYCMSGGPGG